MNERVQTGLEEEKLKYKRKIENIMKGKSKNLQDFLLYMHDLSEKTKYVYMCDVLKFLKFTGKEKEEDLELRDFVSYMAKIQDKDNGLETVSSYQIAVYSALKLFSKCMFAYKIFSKNYMEEIAKPKKREQQRTIERREKSYLTPEETQTYLYNVDHKLTGKTRKPSAIWSQRDITVIKLFLSTGVRCAALSNMDIENLNMDKGTLIVTDKGKKVHTFILIPKVLDELQKWLAYRDQLVTVRDTPALFLGKTGKRLSTSAISDITKKYACNIKGKTISPHKLRATYGTTLYNATGDIVLVQKNLHHASINTTLLYVRGMEEKAQKESVEIMKNII